MLDRRTKLLLVDQTTFVSLMPKMGDRSPYIDHWYVEQRLQQLDEFAPLIAAGARAAQLAARAAPAVGRGLASAGRFAAKAAPYAQRAGAAIGRGASKIAPYAQRAGAAIGRFTGKAGQAAGKVGAEVAKDTAQVAGRTGSAAASTAGKVGAEVAKDTAQVAGKAGSVASAAGGKAGTSFMDVLNSAGAQSGQSKGGGWVDKAQKAKEKLDQFRKSERGRALEKSAREKFDKFRQSDMGKKIEKKATEFGDRLTGMPRDQQGRPFAPPSAGPQTDPFKLRSPEGKAPQAAPGPNVDLGRRPTGPLSRDAPPPSLAPPDPGPLAKKREAGQKSTPPPAAQGGAEGAPAGPPDSEPSGPPQAAAPAAKGGDGAIKQVTVGANATCPAPKNKSSFFGAQPGQKRCHDQTPGRKH